MRPVVRISEFPRHFLLGWDKLGNLKVTLASNEFINVHDRRTVRRVIGDRPLHAAFFVQAFKADTGKGWSQCSDFIHDFLGTAVMHRVAHGSGNFHDYFPLMLAGFGAITGRTRPRRRSALVKCRLFPGRKCRVGIRGQTWQFR